MTAPPLPQGQAGLALRQEEWGRRLMAIVLAWLLFEALTGLSIYFLPFSVPNQWMVLIHTGFGILLLIPVFAYQVRHLRVTWERPLTSIKVMGYLAAAATLVAIASGIVLTVQAVAATRISYAWDAAHVVSTFALLAFTLPHVGVILLRDRRAGRRIEAEGLLAAQRRALRRSGAALLAMGLTVVAAWGLYPGDRLNDVFPADYSYRYGKDRPFAPSLATTATGGAYDPRSFAGSESCGTSGCHEEIAAEWRVSAHRWAAMDPAFQRIQGEMAKQNGPESTRYCGGCHDPISLFSGAKTIFNEKLTGLHGYDEGVACLVCHSIRKTDLQGNAHFVIAQPSRYLFELREGRTARFLRDVLIRAYPRQHTADLSKRLFKTPEYCAACHKQFVDQEVNNVGWVQLQNQYDNWRKSRWNHPDDPRRTIECRECHMPLQASADPASGDSLDYNRSAGDRRHRSHRFLGANQVMPVLLKLPGGEEQAALVEKWLRGAYEIPEIADKWTAGPVVGLELVAPEEVAPGGEVRLRAILTSNKVGHDFPTGPLDIIQSWVEIRVTDAGGREIFTSGTVDDRHFIRPGAFMFKAEPVDQYGNLIDRHNLWEMVGVRYRRSLFPGFSDVAEYTFLCPGSAGAAGGAAAGAGNPAGERREDREFSAPAATRGPLRVVARLLYRKADQYLLNFMFGEGSGLTTPITEMARAEAVIRVGPASGRAAAGERPGAPARAGATTSATGAR
jgi:hypothetical protein